MVKNLIMFFVFFSSIAFSQAIGPRVTVPQIDYDFTHVAEGAQLAHTFMIYNGGGATLYLSNIRTSCKCIVAKLDKNQLAPTDSARLDVDYTNVGNSSKLDNYVSIKTNDPSNPDLRIFITRAVPTNAPTLSQMPIDTTGGVAVTGPSIYFPEVSHDFGVMKQGDISDYVFKFYNRGSSTLKIKDITTSCGCTAALVKSKEIASGKEGELRVQFDSTGKIGKLSRRVTVYTNDPKESGKVLIIYADVVKEKK